MSILIPAYIFLLLGKTGVGKTRLLSFLQSLNEPVLPLEEMARHRGSAFGGNGQPVGQPDKDTFDLQIGKVLASATQKNYLLMEHKGNNLGRHRIPDFLQRALADSVKIEVEAPYELRIHHICEDYFSHPSGIDDAIASLMKMKGMMDETLWNRALLLITDKNIKGFIRCMLDHYDSGIRYHAVKEPAYRVTLMTDGDIPHAASDLADFVRKTVRMV